MIKKNSEQDAKKESAVNLHAFILISNNLILGASSFKIINVFYFYP